MKRVFISYSHKDEALRAELDKHLSLLKRQGELDVWTDHRIPAGGEIDQSISEALEDADIVMLLLSADFMASEYCYGTEMKRAMERHERGEAVVLPVLLRPVDFREAPFGGLKAVPTDARPVTKWPNQDEAFVDIVQHVRQLLMAHGTPSAASPRREGRASEAQRENQEPTAVRVARVSRSSNVSLPRRFTDQDKHDFAASTFEYIRNYFEGSLEELQRRNAGVSSRMTPVSPRAFSVTVFKDGKRVAGCHVRVDTSFGGNAVAFSHGENASDRSHNELLSVEADKQMLYLKPTLAMFHGMENLSQEGAAEHLWSMLISPLQ